MNRIDQYIRRENVTISGLPEHINDIDLEGKVIEALQSIDVNVSSADIVSCHRLGKTKNEKRKKQPSKTIIRFVNRKNASKCLKNKKKLSDTYESLGYRNNLYINEHLCPAHQQILEECLDFKRNKVIASCWSFNDIINIKFSDDRTERPIRIYSVEELRSTIDSRS